MGDGSEEGEEDIRDATAAAAESTEKISLVASRREID